MIRKEKYEAPQAIVVALVVAERLRGCPQYSFTCGGNAYY